MGLKTEVDIHSVGVGNIVLVQNIVQTLVQVFQIEQNDCAASLHADLDLVDVTTHLGRERVREFA